jgi:glycosyltransferase involved in cell wall biosynthesis
MSDEAAARRVRERGDRSAECVRVMPERTHDDARYLRVSSGRDRRHPAAHKPTAVCTMPSTGPEPFSLTVPEAIGHGLPVVGTDHGCNLEIIERAVTGLLVPLGDEACLAGELGRLLRDRALATALSAHTGVLFNKRFRSWRAAQLTTHYDELVGDRPCRS